MQIFAHLFSIKTSVVLIMNVPALRLRKKLERLAFQPYLQPIFFNLSGYFLLKKYGNQDMVAAS